jgi:hypothetical protein
MRLIEPQIALCRCLTGIREALSVLVRPRIDPGFDQRYR